MRRQIFLIIILVAASCSGFKDASVSESLPPIWPDYSFVTVPVNIAPLNFGAADCFHCDKMDVKIRNEAGDIVLSSRGKYALFHLRHWHKTLASESGSKLSVTVSMKVKSGWITYAPFDITVSKDSIDYGLTYRLIPPGYQSFGQMGLYERRLGDFKERTLVSTRMIESGCLNCHTQNRADPSAFCFHVRGKHSATYMRIKGMDVCLNTYTDSTGGLFVYPYWHPSGKYLAFSVNKTRQSFYSSADKMLEVYDEDSDVIVFCPETGEVLRPSSTNRKDKFETKPAFSADGRKLLFSVCDAGVLPDDIRKMKYSLCSIDFNPETGEFGDVVDTLLSAWSRKKTFISPRPSYDGKYILVTEADFGTFLINHKEADLWLYNLETGECHSAGGINSEGTESFHNWSSNSYWAVVSSRRDDGLYTKLYISHFNKDKGSFDKAFLLPQRNPAVRYGESIYSYNTPDFTISPVHINADKVRKLVLSPERSRVFAAGCRSLNNEGR